MVKFSDIVVGFVYFFDMFDNYDDVNSMNFFKGEVVCVFIVDVDYSNKCLCFFICLLCIMSFILFVVDKEILSFFDVFVGDIVRGFVKNVVDNGFFVYLGGLVIVCVKIFNFFDKYLKEWKDYFQVDQFVKGCVIMVDKVINIIEFSFKVFIFDDGYVLFVLYDSFWEGQIVIGWICKVEDFGVFIVFDDLFNVSGFCYWSQMVERLVVDVMKLYKEGDKVKVCIFEIDVKK